MNDDIDFSKGAIQMALIGKTGSGKTTFFYKLLKKYRNQFDIVYIFTTTKREYEDMKITNSQNIMDFDKLHLMKKFTEYSPNNKKRRLIVLDNYVGVAKLKDDVINIFTQGRHNLCSIIVISQYIKEIPPVIRTNCGYIFCFKSSMNDYKIYYDYQEEYSDPKQFLEFMRTNTNDYNPVLLSNVVKIGSNIPSVRKYYIEQ